MPVLNQASFKNFTLTKHSNQYYEIDIFEDGEFGFEELIHLVRAQKEMGGDKLPVIVMCGEYASSDINFLKHLSKNSNDPFSKADAFVLKSMAQKILANFYIRMFTPERPTKFFNNHEDAYNWIKQYMP